MGTVYLSTKATNRVIQYYIALGYEIIFVN